MRPEFKSLRIKQLDHALKPFIKAREIPRPRRGWIRAIREATGIPANQIRRKLRHSSPISYFESAEADYRITLGKLREVAEALDCDLVYALVPKIKTGSIADLGRRSARAEAEVRVRAVEHTMALEDQAVGGLEQKIEEHTRHLLKARTKR